MKSKSARHSEDGPWGLRSDLIITNAILWVAGAGRLGEPKPEVHLYLYDRYSRLAGYYERRGNRTRASRLRIKAEAHYRQLWSYGPTICRGDGHAAPAIAFLHVGGGKTGLSGTQ